MNKPPTPRQAQVLRDAAVHMHGYVTGAGPVVCRNLLAAGWAEQQTLSWTLRTGRDITAVVYVITEAGRAAVGADHG